MILCTAELNTPVMAMLVNPWCDRIADWKILSGVQRSAVVKVMRAGCVPH